jgi:hypothetical protein
MNLYEEGVEKKREGGGEYEWFIACLSDDRK